MMAITNLRVFVFSYLDKNDNFDEGNNFFSVESIKNTIKSSFQDYLHSQNEKTCNEITIISSNNCSDALEKLSKSQRSNKFHLNFIVRDPGGYSAGVLLASEILSKPLGFNIILEKYFHKKFEYSHKNRSIHLDIGTFYSRSNSRDFMDRIFKSLFKQPKIYISYGNNGKNKERDDCISAIDLIKEIEKNANKILPYLSLEYDKKIEMGSTVSGFVDDIINSEIVVLIINKKYLNSVYGMDELSRIIQRYNESKHDIKQRIYIVPMKSGKCIYRHRDTSKVIEFWNNELNAYREETKDDNPHDGMEREISDIKNFIKILKIAPDSIGDIYHQPIEEQLSSNFIDILWKISESMEIKGYIQLYKNKNEMINALAN